MWKLGKVEGVLEGHDGIVCAALVRVHSRMGFVVLKRPVQLLYPLEICDCEVKARRHCQMEMETVVPEAPVRRSTSHRATERLKQLVEDNDSEID